MPNSSAASRTAWIVIRRNPEHVGYESLGLFRTQDEAIAFMTKELERYHQLSEQDLPHFQRNLYVVQISLDFKGD